MKRKVRRGRPPSSALVRHLQGKLGMGMRQAARMDRIDGMLQAIQLAMVASKQVAGVVHEHERRLNALVEAFQAQNDAIEGILQCLEEDPQETEPPGH